MLNVFRQFIYSQQPANSVRDRDTPLVSGCSHHGTQKCNWLCVLTSLHDRGAASANVSSQVREAQSAKRRLRDGPEGGREIKRRAPLFEYIPGTFTAVEVIPDSQDDRAIKKRNSYCGRGTRDKPFTFNEDEPENIRTEADASPILCHTVINENTTQSCCPVESPMAPESEAVCTSIVPNGQRGQVSLHGNLDGSLPSNVISESVGDRDSPALCTPIERLCLPKASVSRLPHDSLTCKERKRLLFQHPPTWVMNDIKVIVLEMHHMLDPLRQRDECWICPHPGKTRGVVRRSFTWKDGENLWHSLGINYGILSRIHHGLMTKEQLHGFIEHSWHLSHLCGNWTCVNPRHHTVEPGSINTGRNKCFRDLLGPCSHSPDYCLKGLKRCLRDKPLSPEALQIPELPASLIFKKPESEPELYRRYY